MKLRFINITAKAGDNDTMSRKDNLRHQTQEAHPHHHPHPHNGGHGKSHDDDDNDDDDRDWNDDDNGGNGENGGGDNCCDSLAMSCVIQDNDPRVHYDGGPWVLETTQSSTSHHTVVEGSTVSLIFNGSALVVFGTVPASNHSEPPTVAYFLDTLPPSITTLPQATADIPNQPLCSFLDLSPNEEHRLFINVTRIQSEAPYALSSFSISPVFCSNSSQSSQSTTPKATSTASPTAPVSASMPDHKTISIVAGVLGSLVFLFIVAILVFLILRWRNARRERVCPENSRSNPETVYSAFTTTESILRNDSSIWSQAVSFNDASSQIPWPSEFSRPTGRDFSWPSDYARSREARQSESVIKFALPPHSKSTSTLELT